MYATAKIFQNGRNQAIRIPAAFAFQGTDEVAIEQSGDRLIVSPVRKSWASFANLPKADDDFMPDRPGLLEHGRTIF